MNINKREVNNTFAESIKPDEIRILTHVTVESANNFTDVSSLYVRYLVDVLPDWRIGETPNGVTHQSRANSNGVHNFGHCFSLDIRRNQSALQPSTVKEEYDCCSTPFVLLEVYDVNGWNRQKSVGYGYASFPMISGSHSTLVPTWRPHKRGDVCQQLRENFLGLAPQIENLNYVGVPSSNSTQTDDDGRLLSRFPFVTETSGEVKIRFDTIIQRGRDALLEHQQRSGILMQHRSHTASSINNAVVDDVIEAYQRARRRLKAAHDALIR